MVFRSFSGRHGPKYLGVKEGQTVFWIFPYALHKQYCSNNIFQSSAISRASSDPWECTEISTISEWLAFYEAHLLLFPRARKVNWSCSTSDNKRLWNPSYLQVFWMSSTVRLLFFNTMCSAIFFRKFMGKSYHFSKPHYIANLSDLMGLQSTMI